MKSRYKMSMSEKDKGRLMSFACMLEYVGKYAKQNAFKLYYYVAAQSKRKVWLVNLYPIKKDMTEWLYLGVEEFSSRRAVKVGKMLGTKVRFKGEK